MSHPSPTLTLDLFVKVAQTTVLNPLFSMWVPILTLSQRYGKNSQPFQLSLAYFLVTLALSLLSLSSKIWTNKSWLSPSPIRALLSSPTIKWEDQIVLVTGGAGGIGRVLVETLAVMKVTVVVIDRVPFEDDRDDVVSYVCDLADANAIYATIAKIQKDVGHPTILVNNAGTVGGKLLLDLTDEDIKRTFDVNVLAQFTLIKALLPNMIEKKAGHIVTIASVFGLAGACQLSDYAASKHAIVGMHESLRLEIRYRYPTALIRTTLILPGHVRTPLFASLAPASPLVSFLAPLVEPHQITKSIIAALETEESREVFVPFYGSILWATKGLPSWARDGLFYMSGANEAMQPFVPPPHAGERKKDL